MLIEPFFGIERLDQVYGLLDETVGMRSYLPLYRGYAAYAGIQNLIRYTFLPSPNTNGAAQFSEIRRPQQ